MKGKLLPVGIRTKNKVKKGQRPKGSESHLVERCRKKKVWIETPEMFKKRSY